MEALLRNLKQIVRDEPGYLASAAAHLAEFTGRRPALDAPAGLEERELHRPMLVSEFSRARAALEARSIEAVVPIRLASRGTRYVLLGRRSGGRRYLSEDLAALGRAASVLSNRSNSIANRRCGVWRRRPNCAPAIADSSPFPV